MQGWRNQNHGKEIKKNEIKEDDKMVLFEGCESFSSLDDLLSCTASTFAVGNVSTTYKVEMENGVCFKVKRARWKRKKKEVDGFLREVGGLRHRNLVSLRAYNCSSKDDELIVISDFLPNGSLHPLLHEHRRGLGRTSLDWTTRLKLAAGVAEGLAFIHTTANLFHGHLTSLNILVDEEGNACISDTALHQLFLTATPSNTGYKAPELMLSSNSYRKFSQTCDIYSFGVILLEILTGKMAIFEGETSLAKWVQCVVRDKPMSEVFDIELLKRMDIKEEEEMMALLQIALLCLAQMPGDRPRMSVVYEMIEDIKTKGNRKEISFPSFHTDISTDSSPSRLPKDDDTAPLLLHK